MNLSDILQSAQGGQGINNLAQQFGISPEQAQAAINAMLPGLSQGLQNQAATPGGLGNILGHLADPQHQQAYANAGAAQAPGAAQAGGNVLNQILGGNIAQQLAQHAAQSTGLSPAVLQQMMPVIASMVMGGLFHSANSQGLGGMLGQLAGQGNLGAVLGQVMGAASGQQQPGGGLGGMLGGLLGGLFGGAAGGAKLPGGLDPATVQAGLSTLTNMLGHGVQVPAGQQSGLQNILAQLAAGATR